jgi:hypothetical protein
MPVQLESASKRTLKILALAENHYWRELRFTIAIRRLLAKSALNDALGNTRGTSGQLISAYKGSF